MKIAYFALRPFDELHFAEKFGEQFNNEFVWTAEYPHADNLSLAKGCEAISITPCAMPVEYIDELYSYGVRHILCRSIGFEHLPLEHMKTLGMTVSNSTYPPDCVANYAIMLMLMTTRKVNETMLRAGVQDYTLKDKMGREIGDLTVGIIGTGNIGKTVIKHLAGFGCRILAYARHPDEELKSLCEYVDLDTLYAESDVISLHVATNAATQGMLNDESFAKMKDGVIIINTARGPLIDTPALIRALKSGKVGEAALDVYTDENNLYYAKRTGEVIDDDNFLLLQAYPNVIMTPHTAFYTETTVSEMLRKNNQSAHCYENGLEDPNKVI